mmetsp:Transcript_1425/g.2311  ORF Transcript_1425/g.2311 Transcript_1425/m.2311 type:complete len:80 (+) Transcript_1425:1-240(+)
MFALLWNAEMSTSDGSRNHDFFIPYGTPTSLADMTMGSVKLNPLPASSFEMGGCQNTAQHPNQCEQKAFYTNDWNQRSY